MINEPGEASSRLALYEKFRSQGDAAQYEKFRSQGEAALNDLVAAFPNLRPLRDENVADNEGMLPHLLLADIIKWVAKLVDKDPEQAQSIMEWLDATYASGSEGVKDLILASGVEALPSPGERGEIIYTFLGPELRSYDMWDRSN